MGNQYVYSVCPNFVKAMGSYNFANVVAIECIDIFIVEKSSI